MPLKVLDLGCGGINNSYGIYSNPDYMVTGIDLNPESIENAKKVQPKHNFILTDGTVIPFEDQAFDIIQCLDVLEHVDDIDQVLFEATRVLKKGGRMIIEVPSANSEKRFLKINSRYWDKLHHVRFFENDSLPNIMEKYDLICLEQKSLGSIHNLTTGYLLRKHDIVNQKGEFGTVTKLDKIIGGFILLIPMLLCKIFPFYFDKKYPKSYFYIFQKS